jgi:hypothetical protein
VRASSASTSASVASSLPRAPETTWQSVQVRYGVHAEGDTVIIRNRWTASALPAVAMGVLAVGCLALGVWLDATDRPRWTQLLALSGFGICLFHARHRFRSRGVAVLDRDGIRLEPNGRSWSWSEIRMVRVVFVPQQGYLLAVALDTTTVTLAPSRTSRVRRLRAISTACHTLMVLHPGVFLFDVLDEPRAIFPSSDYAQYFSTAATRSLAVGEVLTPVARRERRAAWVVLGMTIVSHLMLVAGHLVGEESASTTTHHFEMTPAVQQQIDRLTADVDLCHGFWMSPGAWPPDVEVESVQYLRGTDTVMWTLTAPAGGAVSFAPGGDLSAFTINDVIASYGYTFVGTFTSTPFPPGDRVVLESTGRRLDVLCAEL